MAGFITTALLALADAHVEFIVAGGVALILHGVERTTMDLDISLHMSRENLTRALAVFSALGLKPRAPVPAEDLLDAKKVRRMVQDKHALVFTFVDPARPDRQIDIFLRDDLAYERLARDACAVTIEQRAVRVASRQQLIAMKRAIQPPRAKDLFDLHELERLENNQTPSG